MSTTASPGAGADLGDAFTGLVDDAAIFPPGNAPMPDALRGHAEHRRAWYAPMVGGLVCADARLQELQAALDETGGPADGPLGLVLTVTGGAGAVEPALTWVRRDPRLRLDGVEVALRDEDDLARNAGRMATVLRGGLGDDVPASVEMPRTHGADPSAGWLGALDELAAAGLRAKFRTGGLDPDAFPSAAELSAVVDACLEREVPFKLTAGLHHAVRHTATDTGHEHHGFLNVLVATRALLDGASTGEASGLLEQRDPAAVVEHVRTLGRDRVASTRRWFISFGTCSVQEPVDDLVALALVSEGAHR